MQQHMGQVITIAVYKQTNVETLLHTSGSPLHINVVWKSAANRFFPAFVRW
jgi:hypothetical protein